MSGWILKHVKAKQRNNKLIHLNNYLGSLAVQRLYTDSSSFELTQWRQIKDTSVTCSLSHSLFPDYAFYVSRPPLFASRWKSRLIFRRSGCGAHKSPLVCLISVPNRKLGEMDQGSTPNFLRSAVFVIFHPSFYFHFFFTILALLFVSLKVGLISCQMPFYFWQSIQRHWQAVCVCVSNYILNILQNSHMCGQRLDPAWQAAEDLLFTGAKWFKAVVFLYLPAATIGIGENKIYFLVSQARSTLW